MGKDAQHNWMSERLAALEAEGQLRQLTAARGLVDFSSNDYLGFARDQQLFDTAIKAHKISGLSHGSTGSRLLTGHNGLASEVEAQIAEHLHAEAALLFPTGYQANLGLLSGIATRHDTILYDALVHASIRDGLRLSAARSFSFAHNDLGDLEAKLLRAAGKSGGRVFVISESVFSMDGDQAPLLALSTLAHKYAAHLIIDEAHALGVLGPGGRGKVVEGSLETRVFARVVTFGKALGAQGAAVLGSEQLKRLLLNTARAQIYTTAISPLILQLLKAGFQRLPDCNEERDHLQALVRAFIAETDSIRSIVLAQEGPMLAVLVPGNLAVQQAAEQLQAKGFDVRPIRSPTVAKGSERLRICLHSYNTLDEVRQLASEIVKMLRD